MELRASYGTRRSRWLFLLGYILFISSVWLLATILLREAALSRHFDLALLWALASGITTVVTLALLKFFDPAHLLPRRRDLLTLCLILPIPGLFWKLVIYGFTATTVVRNSEILFITPFVALMAYLYQIGARALADRYRPAYRMVAALVPAEIERLRRSVRGLPIGRKLEIVPLAEFRAGSESTPDWIVYSRQALRDMRADAPVIEATFRGVSTVEFRRLLMLLDYRADLDVLDTWYFLQLMRERSAMIRFYESVKHLMAPLWALLLLIVSLPVLLFIALAIRIDSPGPVIYSQLRCGRFGANFRLFKFRTMREDAETKGGAQWTSEGDERVTRLGNWLRRARLDELPQLFNVLRGDLAFIGPRPERPEIVARLERDLPFFSLRTIVKPGITGWAQVHYGYVASVEESRIKLEYDLFYLVFQSLWLDLAIVMKTFSLFLNTGGGTGR